MSSGPRSSSAELVEQRNWRARALRDGYAATAPTLGKIPAAAGNDLVLGLALGDVHCQREPARIGEARGGLVEAIGDRIRRVGRHTERDELGLFAAGARRCASSSSRMASGGVRWIGAEHLLVHDSTHALLPDRAA